MQRVGRNFGLSGEDRDQHEDEVFDISVEELMDTMDIPETDQSEWLAADNSEFGYRDFSDEEIVRIVREETDSITEEEEEECQQSHPKISHTKACQALEVILSYAEEQPDIPMSTSLIINGLLAQASKKKAKTLCQKSILDFCH